MSYKYKKSKSVTAMVNLTPLIDLVFMLMVFFMLSTSFTMKSRLATELASEGKVSKPSPDKEAIITLKNNKIIINNDYQSIAGLEAEVKHLVAVAPNRKFRVEIGNEVNMQKLVDILSLLNKNNAKSVGIKKIHVNNKRGNQ